MRTFRDDEGKEWQVTVGKESYGTQLMIFSRKDSEEVRQSELPADRPLEAQQVLADMSDDELRVNLADSQPWRG